jgi:N-acetylglutamate synthase-like GNAT family acetyltransferase
MMKSDRVIPRIKIRVAKLEDIESIASVLYESFAEFEPVYTPEAFAATTPTSERLRVRWNEGPVWLAVSNNNAVGTISAVVENDSLYLRSMAVVPAARTQNIGHLFLKEVEVYAIAHSCKRMFLSTTPFLTQAIRLYERYGFARSSDGPDELFGTLLFTMEKRLTSSGLNQTFPNNATGADQASL